MKIFKITAALLSVQMIAAALLCSCGTPADDPTSGTTSGDTTAAETTTEEVTTTEDPLKDSLPDNLDFKGETIRIICRDRWDYIQEVSAEQTGDIVDEAIYTRNRLVEERLKVTLKTIPTGTSLTATTTAVRNSVSAGSDDFDIITSPQTSTLGSLLDGIYLNLEGAKYLDMEKPWWWMDYINEMRIGTDAMYFLEGDINLVGQQAMSCVFFNKPMYQDLFGNPDDLYQLVLDRKWNYDTFLTYVEKSYNDINGNGQYDMEDRYGIHLVTGNTEHFFFTAGNTLSVRDANGTPSIQINADKVSRYLEMLHGLHYNNPGGIIAGEDEGVVAFINGKALFNASRFIIGSGSLREMQQEYGIIPRPLYEDQTEYISILHGNTTIFCVPKTVKKLDAVTASLEALCAESYRMVTPAYYESALKHKYTSDSLSGQMVDLIKAGVTTDFAYLYSPNINEIGKFYREVVRSSTFNFASRWESMLPAAEKGLAELIDHYTKMQ